MARRTIHTGFLRMLHSTTADGALTLWREMLQLGVFVAIIQPVVVCSFSCWVKAGLGRNWTTGRTQAAFSNRAHATFALMFRENEFLEVGHICFNAPRV